MPLHKSSRAPRLDPTMISAPLGDFRHTMHIGRGGDTFGDTSFLSTLGPSSAPADPEAAGSDSGGGPEAENHGSYCAEAPRSPERAEPRQTESVSSLNLDLDLDLGPSMLGDVLGVMDALGRDADPEDVFAPKGDAPSVEKGRGHAERAVTLQKELNGKKADGFLEGDGGRTADGNALKMKGVRPKVRFSDKREEIIRQASEEDEEEEEGHGFDFQDEDELERYRGEGEGGGALTEFTNHRIELPPSPASSHSSEYEGVTALDRRRAEPRQSETDSEEEEEGRGYTFEDEFDDEIGL